MYNFNFIFPGQIYIFGGTGVNSETLSSAETYDPKSDSWKEICDMPEPRSQSAVVSVGGRSGSTRK